MNKILLKLICIVLPVITLSLLIACTNKNNAGEAPDKSGRIFVYTTVYPMFDFTKKIGGDRINLHNLVPSGTEPHDWEPTPRDIARLEEADVLIYNGAGMESWLNRILGSLTNKKLLLIETAKGLQLLENQDKQENLAYDPHVWLNPMNAKKQMEAIKNALVKADPANGSFYEANYKTYSQKFDALDKEYRDTLAQFERKDIVVAHQAFGYLCDAYGLKQVAIEGLGAEAEPTPARMAEITKFAKENNVKVIFFEELINPRVAQVIAEEVGAKTMVLNPVEGLKDEDIKAGKEYFSVMEINLKALAEALK